MMTVQPSKSLFDYYYTIAMPRARCRCVGET